MGAAGFLGSHITDKLLAKDIQVIGVDDLKKGLRENLSKASENSDFHLVIEDISGFNPDLERLDYIFITDGFENGLERIVDLFKKHKARCLMLSSIELYETDTEENSLKELRKAENILAKVASEAKLNARILRLGPVFGPRMSFKKQNDPVIKLIRQTLTSNLQKDSTLEFSSRVLFIDDAADLILRTIFAGSTAQKIFDGVNPEPVKVAEVKQVLLDPVWYEQRDFVFSELPPWPTPNLEKTVKFLNWKPKAKLLSSLKETLIFFKDNEIAPAEAEEDKQSLRSDDLKDQELAEPKEEHRLAIEESKREELNAFKGGGETERKKPEKRKISPKNFSFAFKHLYLTLLIAFVGYALILPLLTLGWGVFNFWTYLNEGYKDLHKGDFERSLTSFKKAGEGANTLQAFFETLEPVKKGGLDFPQIEAGRQIAYAADFLVSSSQSSAKGIQKLLLGLKASTGEKPESPESFFRDAQIELTSASNAMSEAEAILKKPALQLNLPRFIFEKIDRLNSKLVDYRLLLNKAQAISMLLPDLTGQGLSKKYLILLQNNMELRPAGGFIGSFAKVSFEGGKLKKIDVNDVYAIDGALALEVEPPAELKSDLGQKRWFLRDSNWEPDFPTAARQAQWFYTKETGETVDGVIAMDVSAMEKLLAVIGPLELADYNEKITDQNLFEKAVSHAEMSFFPGSQAKKSFLTALASETFNKLFFLPQNNWPAIIAALSGALDEKHISIYLNDPKLFSYADSQGWTQSMPRASKETDKQSLRSEDDLKEDFLALVEANLGANKANYYLDRNLNMETVIGKDGEIKHRLRVSYTNRSPSDTFPAGKYKNRLRLYLPFGSRLTRVLWGERDKTADASAFIDYGKTGYSILLELAPKEQKTLIIDYTVPLKIEFKDEKAKYKLNVIKQAGTLNDPFEWSVTYPISYRLVSDGGQRLGPQEQRITTDLSVDRSFEIEFKK